MRTRAELISSAIGIAVITSLSAPRPPEPPIFTAAEALDNAKTAHAQGNGFWEFTWTWTAALYGDKASSMKSSCRGKPAFGASA